MKSAAGGGFGFLQGVLRKEVRGLGDEASGSESFFDVVAFQVNVGIDLVGDAVVALIAFEADVVRRFAYQHSFAFYLVGRLPAAQMVARSDEAYGFGVSPAVILRAAEEVELAHRHGHVGFFGKAAEDAMENSAADVGVHFDPAGGGEDALHGGFRAKDQEIDHVAGIAVFVADAARDLREEIFVDSRKGVDLLGDDTIGATFRCVDLDANNVRARTGVIAGLVDADEKAPGDGSNNVAARADQERLRGVLIADAADECPASRLIEGQNAEKVLEAAREAVGAVLVLHVRVTGSSAIGDQDVLAGLNVNARIQPERFTGDLDFLGNSLLSGRAL